MKTACPDPEVWRELLAGRLAEERLEALAGHLDRCPRCRQAVD
jgi:hypothetical protein